jgi:hypothetical protein
MDVPVGVDVPRPDVPVVTVDVPRADVPVVPPTAFRINSLTLRDPHAFTSLLGGCPDITDAVNTQLSNAVTMDGNMDGSLDLSIVSVFRPLDQSTSTNRMDIVLPECTAPTASSSTRCTRTATSTILMNRATNLTTGTCLDTMPTAATTTTAAFTPAPTVPTGPCFSSDSADLPLNLGGIMLTLRSARIGAQYMGTPATQLVQGLIRGFVAETDANAATLPTSVLLVGGQPFSHILPGGTMNCASGTSLTNAVDMGPGPSGASVRGWWLYINFTAVPVPYSEP